MKRLFIFVLLLTPFFSFSQSASVYRPFPTQYGHWSYPVFDDFGNFTGFSFQYLLSGDTIIGGVSYKQIFKGDYQGAIREDSKIVYFIPDTSSVEVVLYDFNLGLGDTVFHPFGGSFCSNDTLVVYRVDSVLASDGYHRTLDFNVGVTWIEGVGSNFYLLEPLQYLCVSGNEQLGCAINDSLFNYSTFGFSCYNSVEEDIIAPSLTLFPNPSNGTLNIQWESGTVRTITFTDLMGRVYQHENVGRSAALTLYDIPGGTWFLQVEDQAGRKSVEKVIVTR